MCGRYSDGYFVCQNGVRADAQRECQQVFVGALGVPLEVLVLSAQFVNRVPANRALGARHEERGHLVDVRVAVRRGRRERRDRRRPHDLVGHAVVEDRGVAARALAASVAHQVGEDGQSVERREDRAHIHRSDQVDRTLQSRAHAPGRIRARAAQRRAGSAVADALGDLAKGEVRVPAILQLEKRAFGLARQRHVLR